MTIWTPEDIEKKKRENSDLARVNPTMGRVNLKDFVGGPLAGKDFEVPIFNPDIFSQESAPPFTHRQQASMPKTAPVNKYHVAKKEDRIYNGVLYASKKEAQFASDLDLRIKAGEIDFWLRQVPFILPGNTTYRLDFMTFTARTVPPEDDDEVQFWVLEYIEVKGKLKRKNKKGQYVETELPMGKLKRKQCEQIYKIHIEVV